MGEWLTALVSGRMGGFLLDALHNSACESEFDSYIPRKLLTAYTSSEKVLCALNAYCSTWRSKEWHLKNMRSECHTTNVCC